MTRTLRAAVVVTLASLQLMGCDGNDNNDNGGGDPVPTQTPTPVATATPGPATAQAVIANYADLLHANYADAEADAEALHTAIHAFVDAPSAATLAAAKQAWLDARPVYQQSEVGRFYEGPIDDSQDGPEGLINAWPLDENYIDYVEGNPNAGIINDPVNFPEITPEVLAAANEAGGEANIATGWHAIEFLLWGQDLSAGGPGERPFTDYVTDGTGTAANQERRGQYLEVTADLLIENLHSVTEEWEEGRPGNFRAAFVAADPDESLQRILTGIGTLAGGELAGERLSVAFETRNQEDEHSCFSDNTHIDHFFDQLGIQNVYLGRYGTLDGPGIDELVRQVDPALDTRLQAELATALAAIEAIPEPFDQAFLGADTDPGRQAIAAALDALFTEADSIADAAEALGVSINLAP